MTNLANARVAASNLYNATRELALKAKEHELMGTSHDLLQQLVNDAEQHAAEMEQKDKTIEALNNVIRELEKKPAAAAAPEGKQ